MPDIDIKKKLQELRKPFPDNQIGHLPKPTKQQTDEVKENFNLGVRCKLCEGWHHPKVQHLQYVGHAAATDRLLDVDPEWNWEPIAFHEGLPKFDSNGGLWIKLTICGVTRLGYGSGANSSFKEVGSREKEVIGDAIRNAALRFGVALDFWHKGDLHGHKEVDTTGTEAGAQDIDPKIGDPKPKVEDQAKPGNELQASAVDTNANKPAGATRKPSQAAQNTRINQIYSLAKQNKWTEAELKKVLQASFNAQSINQLNDGQYKQLKQMFDDHMTVSQALSFPVEVCGG